MKPSLIRPRALILAGTLLAVLAALALVFAFRTAILERVMLGQLEAMGLPAPRLTVSQASLSRLTIEDLKLGTADEATVERIEVRYEIFDDGPSPVRSVRIEKPVMWLDLESGGPPLGSLQALLDGGDSGGGRSVPPLPEIALVEGRAELLTPLGAATVALDGQARSDGAGGVAASLAYEALGGPARLRGAVEGALDAEGAVSAALTIDDGAIALTPAVGGVEATIGGLTGRLDAALRDGRPEKLEGRLALTDLGLQQARFRDADLSFSMTDEGFAAEGELRAEDDRLRAAFLTTLRDPLGEAAFGLGLSLGASAEAALFERVAQPFSRGWGSLTLQASGQLPPLPADTPGGLRARLLAGQAEGRFGLALVDLAVPDRLSGLEAEAEGTLRLADGSAAVALKPGARGALAALDAAWLGTLGLPPDLTELLAGGLLFGLEPVASRPAGAVIRPGDDALEIELDGRLSAGGHRPGDPGLTLELRQALVTLAEDFGYLDVPDFILAASELPPPAPPGSRLSLAGSLFGQPEALESELLLRATSETLRQGDLRLRDLSLRLPLRASLLEGALEVQLADRGEVTVASLSHASGLRLTKPARLTLTEGTLLASPPSAADTGGDRFAHDIRGRLGGVSLAYAGGDGEPLPITLQPARLKAIGEREGKAAYRGRIQVDGGGIALPGLEAALQRLSARLDFDAGFEAPALRLTSDLSYRALPRFRLDAKAEKRGRRIAFEAELGASGGPLAEQGLRPRIEGSYDLAQGRADFALAPLRLTFAPGLLQPGDLAAELAELKRVTGSVAAQASGAWAEGRLAGQGGLQVRELGLIREDIAVQGLSLDLALDSLWPARSLPGQRLTIQKIDSAVPLEAVDATFRLLPGSPAKAEVADLGFTLAGSRFRIRQVLLDPAAERHSLSLEAASLDLQSLLGELAVEGLSGSGRLSGVLPVALAGETLVIRDGRLESRGPGVLSYRRDSAGPALPEGPPAEEDPVALFQDPVELTMRALENFHYDRLSIRVDKQAGGQAALEVQLEGKNPDLLDGYPFNLNINLTGDVTPVLDALARGIDLTQDLVSRSWKLQP